MLSSAILAFIMIANALIARLAKLPREDMIVLLFCGSKKSLVSGAPMAGALFAPAQVGLVVLPLMIFHQLAIVRLRGAGRPLPAGGGHAQAGGAIRIMRRAPEDGAQTPLIWWRIVRPRP